MHVQGVLWNKYLDMGKVALQRHTEILSQNWNCQWCVV